MSVHPQSKAECSTLYIVLGNDNSEIVCDYTCGDDDSLDDIITAHYDYWHACSSLTLMIIGTLAHHLPS
jgi:hypothetical protein